MSVDVTVLRVFTDSVGNFGNPLGVVDAATVEPDQHQHIAAELGYSETVFINMPAAGSTTADARIESYANGQQLRSGILIGYWDEAELVAARAQLDGG